MKNTQNSTIARTIATFWAVTLVLCLASISQAAEISSLQGDFDGFSGGDAADVITNRSQRVIDLINNFPSSHDFDEDVYNGVIGWTHHFQIPSGMVVTAASLEVRIQSFHLGYTSDFLFFEDLVVFMEQSDNDRINLSEYGYTADDIVITIDLSQVPVLDYDQGVTNTVNFLEDLNDGEFDVALLDDSMIDYALLRMTVIQGPVFTQPVAYWMLDEGTGPTANDYVGNNDGTVIGPVWTTGQVGGALSFDGFDDYVDLGNNSSLEFGYPITISAWINLDRLNDNAIVATDANPSCYSGVWLQVNNGLLEVAFGDGSGAGASTRRSKKASTALQIDTWYHVAGVIRGAIDMDIYINGVNDGGIYSGSGGNVAFSSANAAIGKNAPWDLFFQGLIDEVAIYDKALSAYEIQQQYFAGLSGEGYPVRLPTPRILELKKFRVEWDAVIGETYQVQGSIDLENWVNIGPAIVADNDIMFVVDETWVNKKYYRIILVE
jgi:Concanavalin A-like lectin/glucanases superfamily